MWTVIYIAPNKAAAERIKEMLTREGLLVNLRPTGLGGAQGAGPVEVMVPQGEAKEAHAILTELLGRVRY